MLWYGYAAIITLFAAELGLYFNVQLVLNWFYILAWWSFIFFIDAVNYKVRKDSLLKRNPAFFVYISFVSVFYWLIFEVFNFTLKNWLYVKLPVWGVERWLGYFISFATVVPAVMETYELLCHLNGKISFKIPVIRLSNNGFFLFGIVMLGMTLLLPEIFFPLVWVGFIFVFEPFNKLSGKPLLNDLKKIVSLLESGLICGFLWEFWNFWAESKWVYQIPYFSEPKIFEMPAAGYLGFLPFALETYGFYTFSAYFLETKLKSVTSVAAFVAALLLFYAGCFYLIDTITVLK